MTATPPEVNLQGRYSSVETVAILKISRPTLRTYAKKGLIKYGVHRSNGRKFFTGKEIIRLWKSER